VWNEEEIESWLDNAWKKIFDLVKDQPHKVKDKATRLSNCANCVQDCWKQAQSHIPKRDQAFWWNELLHSTEINCWDTETKLIVNGASLHAADEGKDKATRLSIRANIVQDCWKQAQSHIPDALNEWSECAKGCLEKLHEEPSYLDLDDLASGCNMEEEACDDTEEKASVDMEEEACDDDTEEEASDDMEEEDDWDTYIASCRDSYMASLRPVGSSTGFPVGFPLNDLAKMEDSDMKDACDDSESSDIAEK